MTGQEVFIQDVVRRGRAGREAGEQARRRLEGMRLGCGSGAVSGEAMDCCETRLLQAPEVGARYIFGVANKPEVLKTL